MRMDRPVHINQQIMAESKPSTISREQIKQIADKVYALWKRDVEILRERRRVHGRSFPKR